ncbi:MAG TPA: M10 family metallopeptidase C-terminal domain-containing protein, partial [Allosphingosinicella sp.]|nr:M10 family metallopeptidase C-terminal domain-containing protein [Allosphingosinicella sp.]
DERYARGGGTEFDYNITLSDSLVAAGAQLTVSGALLTAGETMILDAGAETDGSLRLFGGAARDTLKGGAGADLIHGNLGGDLLWGGGGADMFRYDKLAESSNATADQIFDFTPGTDKIDLSRIDANSLVEGNQAFTWVPYSQSGMAGTLSAHAFSGGAWLIEGHTDSDGMIDLLILVVPQGPTPIGAGDFLL